MNGSFESPSYLERRIRAEIEDLSDSSLSTPGFGRRAKSESLSFQTEDGTDDGRGAGTTHQLSYQPSLNRILPDLSEIDTARTPTTTQTTRASNTVRGPATLSTALQYPDIINDSMDTVASSSGKSPQSTDLAASTSTDGRSETGPMAASERSLPLTSTPQKTSYTHLSQNTFHSQRSSGGSLARKAAEAAARDATRTSTHNRSVRNALRDSNGSAWSDATRETQPGRSSPLDPREQQQDVSVGSIEPSLVLSDGRPSTFRAVRQPRAELSNDPESSSARQDDLDTEEIRTEPTAATGTRTQCTEEADRHPCQQNETAEQDSTDDDCSSSGSISNSARVSSTGRNPTSSGMATPKPSTVSSDRMQSYVLSSIKDPAREQRILQSAKRAASNGLRICARRVPITQNQNDSEDSSVAVSRVLVTPAAPHRSDRLGRPMTIAAGRTPLPFRPSHLANEVVPNDASSQASAESSTYDLMTPARGWANTSLPGLGVAEGNVPQVANRVDPQKLSRHLHKLNEGLLDENTELKEAAALAKQEAESLRRQLNSALREKENLSRQLLSRREGQELTSTDVPLPPSLAAEDDVANLRQALEEALDGIRELEGHKEELNDMLDALESEHEKVIEECEKLRDAGHASSAPQGNATVEREALLLELETDLKNCEEDLRNRDEEIQRLQEELQASEQQRADLHTEIKDAANFAMQQTGKFEEEKDAAVEDAQRQRSEVDTLRRQVEQLEMAARRTLRAARDSNLGAHDDDVIERDGTAQMCSELADVKKALREAEDAHHREREELEDVIRAHEEDLQVMEDERKQLDGQVQDLAHEADELRDELDRQCIAVEEKQNEILKLTRQVSGSQGGSLAGMAKIDQLEKELREARQQLRLLKSGHFERELAATEMELQSLRQQKQSLEDRLNSYKQQEQTSISLANAAAPGSSTNLLTKTPAKHRSLLNLQTPIKTPASPGQLSSASWLYNESSLGNTSVVEHIKQLEELLAMANCQLDEKLSEIDRQGVNHLTLTKRLFEAQDRIEALEAELERLAGTSMERQALTRRVKQIRCHSCKALFDASAQVRLPWSDGDEGSNKAATMTSSAFSTTMDPSENRKARSLHRDQALAQFLEKIPQLTAKLTEMEEENRVLRDAQSKANQNNAGRPRSAVMVKDTVRQLQQITHTEMDRARAAIVDLNAELREERRRLPDLARNSKLFGDLSSAAERDLARTERRLRTLESELRRKAAEHSNLQRELVEKSTVGTEFSAQVQLLESQVKQAAKDIEHLRQDKNAILQTRQELHEQFRTASERYASVQAELAATKQAAAAHQAQLDDQTAKIEQLHVTLKTQHEDIRRLTGERSRLHAQREDILRDVSTLEADLRRVRGESQRFGQDLEKLRLERDQQLQRTEAVRETSTSVTAEAQETIAQLKNKLSQAQTMIRQLELREDGEEANAPSVSTLRAKHAAECKGLLVQICYLKTKFMRESDLRQDLCFQKSYLLQVLGGLDLSEKETVRFLADLSQSRRRLLDASVGDETLMAHPRPRGQAKTKLRKALLTTLAATRMRLMAANWRQTRTVRGALLSAHQAARKRRDQRLAVPDSENRGDMKDTSQKPPRGGKARVRHRAAAVTGDKEDDEDDALLLGGGGDAARTRLAVRHRA